MTRPLLAVLLLLSGLAAAEPLEQDAADGRRLFDAGASRAGAAPPESRSATQAARVPRERVSRRESEPSVIAGLIERALRPQSLEEQFLTGAQPYSPLQRQQLLEWQAEVRREGGRPWLRRMSPPPGEGDRRMLALLAPVMPGTDTSLVHFIPFGPQESQTMLGRVLGGRPGVEGVEFEEEGRSVAVVNASLPPITRWVVTIHELLHTRQPSKVTGGEAMKRLTDADAGACEKPGREPVLFGYLLEGHTQRQTLQIVARLLQAGRRAREEQQTWNRFLSAVGLRESRASTAEERAGLALLDDFRFLEPGESRELEELGPSQEAERLPMGGAYKSRVAVVAAAMRDPTGAAALRAWLERASAEAWYRRQGRDRVVVAGHLADISAVFEGFDVEAVSRHRPGYEALLKAAVQPGPADAAFRGAFVDLFIALKMDLRDHSGPPARERLAGWHADAACRPGRVFGQIGDALERAR